MTLKNNIENIRNRINAACERAGRNPQEVTLICVSKTIPADKYGCLTNISNIFIPPFTVSYYKV